MAAATGPEGPPLAANGKIDYRIIVSLSAWCTALVLGLPLLAGAGGSEAVPYGVGYWREDLGNHRALLRVSEKAEAVWAHIPWRRRDAGPEEKDIIVIDATTGKRILNVFRANVTREFADLVFEPATAPGDYEIYYLPHTWVSSNLWQRGSYLPAQATGDPAWLERHGLRQEPPANAKWRMLPRAEVIRLEARSDFDRFDPMEVIATAEEIETLLNRNAAASYLLFPEDRRHPIRMANDLPLRWIERGPSDQFSGRARPDEFYVFQIGVYAARMDMAGLALGFRDMTNKTGKAIPRAAFKCFNLGGTDWLGRPMKKTFAVANGKVGALWIGVQIPRDAAGLYQGTMTVRPHGAKPTDVKLNITVAGRPLDDHGDSELWRLSRLRWLDSTIGLDDDDVAPFTPLKLHGRTIECLGREVRFAATGLPASIRSGGKEILAAPIAWTVETVAAPVAWTGARTRTVRVTRGTVERQTTCKGRGLALTCRSKTEFDGCIHFMITLQVQAAADVNDIRLEIPVAKEIATYMMGFSRQGGYRPKAWEWTWDINRCDNMVWIGDVDAGLQCKPTGARDTWELYNLMASGIPESWGNDGKGGATVTEEGDRVMLRIRSGPRSLRAGETLEFRFRLLITPFKPIDSRRWQWRYGNLSAGGTIVHLHHGPGENPYINYPFIKVDELRAFVRRVHEQGGTVNIYYTVRELSNHVAEMWALRSLGDEVFVGGPGGGFPWLQEHLVSGYRPAWMQSLPDGDVDAAILTTGLSRWHNYYLEGLAWLMKETQVDGLYLDGIGYDREIMKRVRRTMERMRPGAVINFHSGDNFTYNNGRVSPANQYMEHLPYISSLWFGEFYDYDQSPDYWLVEISGIPFGLSGEMLNYENGGNQWRGMIYGMTGRFSPAKEALWKLWDEFGIEDAKMLGYWDPGRPVRTSRDDVLATAYCKPHKVLVSLASWATERVKCRLEIDWKAIGLDPATAMLSAPEVANFQQGAVFSPTDEIPVEPGRGWLLVLQ